MLTGSMNTPNAVANTIPKLMRRVTSKPHGLTWVLSPAISKLASSNEACLSPWMQPVINIPSTKVVAGQASGRS